MFIYIYEYMKITMTAPLLLLLLQLNICLGFLIVIPCQAIQLCINSSWIVKHKKNKANADTLCVRTYFTTTLFLFTHLLSCH